MLDLLLRKGERVSVFQLPESWQLVKFHPSRSSEMLVFGPFNGSIPHYSEMKFQMVPKSYPILIALCVQANLDMFYNFLLVLISST